MNPEVVWVFIPICALMIPIIALLTAHQQKMARIVHESHVAASNAAEIEALKLEVQSLKDIVHQQAIALDDRPDLRAAPPPSPSIAQRLKS